MIDMRPVGQRDHIWIITEFVPRATRKK